jgi:hypothetical protein
MRDGMPVQLCDGAEDLEAVGEASYQDNLWWLAGGRQSPDELVRVEVVAVLVAEADNPYDPNAVALWVNGLKVGYLSCGDAARYRPGLLALQQACGTPVALAGVIAGGMRADGPGRLELFLRHDRMVDIEASLPVWAAQPSNGARGRSEAEPVSPPVPRV